MAVLAITGGTGFVGGRLIALAVERGHRVRALTRRSQPERDGVTWVPGSLEDAPALARLVDGADAVIHVAGVVNAPDRDGFAKGNVEGTQAMLMAADGAGVRRFVHVSSLAAREPQLSSYGWSKAEADKLVTASSLDWTIVRPPAIYGPGDHEMLDLFRLARWHLALLPPGGRLSVIHVDDLCRLLLTLAEGNAGRIVLDPDDGTPDGWTHRGFAQAIGRAMDKRVLAVPLPKAAMRIGTVADRLIRRKRAKLTADRVAYFCHRDWVSSPENRPPAQLWQPQIATPAGLRDTARWYRAQGLL